MDDDAIFNEKMGKAEIKLDKIGLEQGPVNNYEVKVDRRLFSKDSKMYLNLSWEA
jgi:hypothetical protein